MGQLTRALISGQDQAAAILYLAVTFSKMGLFASQGAWEEASQGGLGHLQVSLCALKKSPVGHSDFQNRSSQGQWGAGTMGE